MARADGRIAGEDGGQDDEGRQDAEEKDERGAEDAGELALAENLRRPGEQEQDRDDVGGGDLGGEKREGEQQAEREPSKLLRVRLDGGCGVQRPAASEPGRASSISMTGMSETIG